MRMNRRQLLQAALVGAAGGIPLMRALEGVSRADGPGSLTNFICVYHPHGVSAEYWALRSSDSESTFDIAYQDCSLQPFDDAATYGKSFKDKLLVIEGIDHLSNANGHDSAGTILTRSDSTASIAGLASSSMRQNHWSEISGSIGAPERWLWPTECT